MKSFKSIFTLLLSLLSVLLLSHTEFVYTANSLYESQIFSESSEVKVRKLQEVFKGLGLYFGEVDGKFSSIERDLLNYQKKAGIIVNDDDYGAGYFGKKTMEALESEFGDKYLTLKEEFLKADEPSTDERYFYVTAYYTPLPGQSAYTTGSYSAEIKLNGSGNSASGNGLYAGLLAAPRNYPFGTKIYLEGLGVGEVGDRGGAIVNSGERGHEYDRLDIWVGYGDEGRIRAKTWGIRTVKGQVLEGNYEVSIEFDESVVSKYSNLKVDASNPTEESVRNLQDLFTKLGLYNGEIDGDFYKIKDVLIDYQLNKGIISSRTDDEAGYFGTKTVSALKNDYGSSSGLFIEKYFAFGEETKTISDEGKANMELVKRELDKALAKIFNGDVNKIASAKIQIKVVIDNYANNLADVRRQKELKYLLEVM